MASRTVCGPGRSAISTSVAPACRRTLASASWAMRKSSASTRSGSGTVALARTCTRTPGVALQVVQAPFEVQRDRGQALRQRVVDLAREAGALLGAGQPGALLGQ